MGQIIRHGLLQTFATVFFFAWTFAVAQGQIHVKLPEGFTITKVAGDELATNIFCMTLNSRGQPVVSGPGYIKTLVDSNADGLFDNATVFSNSPANGAQGMKFVGDDLLCTGDAGLLVFRDKNGDAVADEPPETLMPIRTGGEHMAHALRVGPDDWLYLIAGNQTPILPEYFGGQNSPVKKPDAGFLMRISPDLETREIVAHGFRNAYDFDFNSAGEIFVYDSDGERDITLPWYRPTRVFQIRPGDHAGWISAAWKRPSEYFDMPTEIGALGRGSPTGVSCYRGGLFPAEFTDAIFVGDWTFGRIVVFKRDPKTKTYDRGTQFAISQGQFGFAVTDLEVAPDGSLLVSVGGRGTEGGVYRISCDSADSSNGKLAAAAVPDDEHLQTVRSLSGQAWGENELSVVLRCLMSDDREVRVAALELMVGREDFIEHLDEYKKWQLSLAIKKNLSPLKKTEARLVFRMIKNWPNDLSQQVCGDIEFEYEAELLVRIAKAREPNRRAELLIDCFALLNTASVNREMVLRLAQLTMDGCGPGKQQTLVFHGYTAQSSLEFTPSQQEQLVQHLDALFKRFHNDSKSQLELIRLMAMLGNHLPNGGQSPRPDTPTITDEIHWLICAAQMESKFSRDAILSSLLGLEEKVQSQNRETDQNWTPRIKELAKRLIDKYQISSDIVASKGYGKPGHVILHEAINDQSKSESKRKFEAAIASSPANATVEQFRIATSNPDTLDRVLAKRCSQETLLRDEALLALAANPQADEINLYKKGLGSWNVRVVKRCAIALRRLLKAPDADVQIAAMDAATRLGWDKPGVSVRDQLILLLQKQTGQQFGYQQKSVDRVQNKAVDAWKDFLKQSYPNDTRLHKPPTGNWQEILGKVDWSAGDANRGEKLYTSLQCAQCHDRGSRQGPRLEGITNRFSKRDLFRSIVMPSEQVPDRYRALVVATNDGFIYNGTIIYESVDGITLMESSGRTVRINHDDIEARTRSDKSTMPEGLLNDVDAQGYADLFSFLNTRYSGN